jgi:hypothetical protein
MKVLLALALLILASSAAYAATQQDAEAALARAKQVEAEAGKLGNRWVPAEAMLKSAEKSIEDQDWDKAVAAATEAQALAERAIAQSKEQESAWRDAVIR